MYRIVALMALPLLGACSAGTIPDLRAGPPAIEDAIRATPSVIGSAVRNTPARVRSMFDKTDGKDVVEDGTGNHSAFLSLPDTPKYRTVRAAQTALVENGYHITSFAPTLGVITGTKGTSRMVINVSRAEPSGSEAVFVASGFRNIEEAVEAVRNIQAITTNLIIPR
jgi:hypothetical protein